MTSSNGNIFRITGYLCGEFTGQWRGALMFYFLCAWINGWVSNGEAGDWRRHRAHYDVTVMTYCFVNGLPRFATGGGVDNIMSCQHCVCRWLGSTRFGPLRQCWPASIILSCVIQNHWVDESCSPSISAMYAVYFACQHCFLCYILMCVFVSDDNGLDRGCFFRKFIPIEWVSLTKPDNWWLISVCMRIRDKERRHMS